MSCLKGLNVQRAYVLNLLGDERHTDVDVCLLMQMFSLDNDF